MNRQIIFILTELAFLVTALFTGTPFDFRNIKADSYATYTQALFIILIFVTIFIYLRRIDEKKVKILILIPTVIIAIIYFFIGIWTSLIVTPDFHPMWQDTHVYTNKKGAKIVKQWRETSGSIYDYRDQKIIADYGNLRIFLPASTKSLKGIWIVFNIEKKSIDTINFDKRKGK